MVRALLDGSKTQTRRICKAWNFEGEEYRDSDGWPLRDTSMDGTGDVRAGCPYGVPGDRLWVRESAWYDCEVISELGALRCFFEGRDVRFSDGRAGLAPFACTTEMLKLNSSVRQRPGIHMPRWASRITLEVTGVRVERLQAISRGDAMAEGCPFPNMAQGPDPRQWYADLWNSIHGAGSWAENPWVWVMKFRRLRCCPA